MQLTEMEQQLLAELEAMEPEQQVRGYQGLLMNPFFLQLLVLLEEEAHTCEEFADATFEANEHFHNCGKKLGLRRLKLLREALVNELKSKVKDKNENTTE